MKIELTIIRTVILGFAAMIALVPMGCKKSKDKKPPQAITVTAKKFQMTLAPNSIEANTATAIFDYNGVEMHVGINRVDESNQDGIMRINNTDIVGSNSSYISVNSVETVGIKNTTTPNSIALTLNDDEQFSKITLQFDANTEFYFSDQPNRAAYLADMTLLRTNVTKVAAMYNDYQLSVAGDQSLPVVIYVQ